MASIDKYDKFGKMTQKMTNKKIWDLWIIDYGASNHMTCSLHICPSDNWWRKLCDTIY